MNFGITKVALAIILLILSGCGGGSSSGGGGNLLGKCTFDKNPDGTVSRNFEPRTSDEEIVQEMARTCRETEAAVNSAVRQCGVSVPDNRLFELERYQSSYTLITPDAVREGVAPAEVPGRVRQSVILAFQLENNVSSFSCP